MSKLLALLRCFCLFLDSFSNFSVLSFDEIKGKYIVVQDVCKPLTNRTLNIIPTLTLTLRLSSTQ